LSMDGGSWEAT